MGYLVFDTNGNLLNKDVHYNFIKELPDAIVNYMKKHTSATCGFFNNFMIRGINNKGEITYCIDMWESPNPSSRSDYRLRFKSTGELISKENIDASW
jgi:hypothetical protein